MLLQVNSPSAIPRTMTVSVCVAALPPIPATMGMNTASAVICEIVPSNNLTTEAAMNAVNRFTISHGSRFLSDSRAGVKTRSSPARPANRYRSSVASSLMTSMTSSTVMMPTSLFSSSTTGIASRLYDATIRATSSWSVSTRTLMTSAVMIRFSGVSGDTSSSRRSETTPTRCRRPSMT